MNNSSSILELVNKIPTSLYFSEIPDRQQALKYLDYLYTNVPVSRQVDPDKLFREVISRELRIVSMKIIEPEILLLVALDKITLADFKLSSGNLVCKVIEQNPDKYDLDIMQRVMAQIMTKLPRDLRDRVAGKHKLQIFQLIARNLNMDPKLLEKFANYDPSLNSTVSMELDAGDYNTINKKYLQELYNYQQKQPYISANSLEYGSLAAEIALSQPTGAQTINQVVSKAQYIDQSPSLMVGTEDKTLYYFDPSSGTLSEMPLNNNQTPISVQDLKTILASQKINQADIQGAVDALKSTIPNTTLAAPTDDTNTLSTFFSGLENSFSGLITGTTQAQAILQTTSNIASTEPVPPAFLTKLYNLKHGQEQQTNGNYSDKQSDNYTKMISGLRGNRVLANTLVLGNTSATGDNGYTQNAALPLFNVTNPQTTYAAFSGPAPHQTYTMPNTLLTNTQVLGNTTTTMPSTSTTTIHSPNTTTTTIHSPNTTTIHSPSTSTAKSGFANLGANSQVISTEQTVAAKIKNDTKNVEKIAIGLITILILIFLVVVIIYVKNAKSSS